MASQPILVFDGDCGFCTASARWLERRLPADGGIAVQPWQVLDLEELGLSEHDVTTAAWWIDSERRRHRGHRAIAEVLSASKGPWPVVGRVLKIPPVTWVAAAVYALVARYRYRLPGATDACRLPT